MTGITEKLIHRSDDAERDPDAQECLGCKANRIPPNSSTSIEWQASSTESGKMGTVWRLHTIEDRRSLVLCRSRVSTASACDRDGKPGGPEILLGCSRGSAMKNSCERPAVNKMKWTRGGSAREGRHGSRQ
jgi:hypothetical protein